MRAETITLGSSRWAATNELITIEEKRLVEELDAFYDSHEIPTQVNGIEDGNKEIGFYLKDNLTEEQKNKQRELIDWYLTKCL